MKTSDGHIWCGSGRKKLKTTGAFVKYYHCRYIHLGCQAKMRTNEATNEAIQEIEHNHQPDIEPEVNQTALNNNNKKRMSRYDRITKNNLDLPEERLNLIEMTRDVYYGSTMNALKNIETLVNQNNLQVARIQYTVDYLLKKLDSNDEMIKTQQYQLNLQSRILEDLLTRLKYEPETPQDQIHHEIQ